MGMSNCLHDIDHILYGLTRKIDEIPHTNVISYRKGEVFIPQRDYIYILRNGNIAISNPELDIHIGFVKIGMPIGIFECIVYDFKLDYICTSDISMLKIYKDVFFNLFHINTEESRLLYIVSAFFCTSMMQKKTIRQKAYNSIIAALYQYNNLYNNSSFHQEGVATYIINRTGLSRSYVFEILSDLKSGGYIAILKGKSLQIHKNIPSSY